MHSKVYDWEEGKTFNNIVIVREGAARRSKKILRKVDNKFERHEKQGKTAQVRIITEKRSLVRISCFGVGNGLS